MKLIYQKNKNFKYKYYNLNKNIFITHTYNNLFKSYFNKLLYYLKYFYLYNTNIKYKIYFNNKYNISTQVNLWNVYCYKNNILINNLYFNINYFEKHKVLKYILLNIRYF